MAIVYEKYLVTGVVASFIHAGLWGGQSFTPSTAHQIQGVRLLLYRIGTLTTITVSIRATDGDGKPTGADLTSGTADVSALTTATSGAFQEILFDAAYGLSASTKYAIVIKQTGSVGNESNTVRWLRDNVGTYAGGEYLSTSNSGSTWSTLAGNDNIFAEFGIPGVPTVSTQVPTSIAVTTATGNGRIENIGSGSVTQHGHCWNTTGAPTTADSKTTNGAGALGAFTSAITGLTFGTTYYVRAYATNATGTAYGDTIRFESGDPTSILVPSNLAWVGNYLVGLDANGNRRKFLGDIY